MEESSAKGPTPQRPPSEAARERYLLHGVVAEGGQGRLLRAEELHLERMVALKELSEPGGTGPRVRRYASRTGEPLEPLKGHTHSVLDAAFSPEGRLRPGPAAPPTPSCADWLAPEASLPGPGAGAR